MVPLRPPPCCTGCCCSSLDIRCWSRNCCICQCECKFICSFFNHFSFKHIKNVLLSQINYTHCTVCASSSNFDWLRSDNGPNVSFKAWSWNINNYGCSFCISCSCRTLMKSLVHSLKIRRWREFSGWDEGSC